MEFPLQDHPLRDAGLAQGIGPPRYRKRRYIGPTDSLESRDFIFLLQYYIHLVFLTRKCIKKFLHVKL